MTKKYTPMELISFGHNIHQKELILGWWKRARSDR